MLIHFNDIDYSTRASLLLALAGQWVAQPRNLLNDESEIRSVLDLDRQLIAQNISAKMMTYFYEAATMQES